MHIQEQMKKHRARNAKNACEIKREEHACEIKREELGPIHAVFPL